MNFAPYQSAVGCTRYGPAGPEAFMVYMEDRFPYQTSMGICACRFTGTGSWSHHAECRAYDQGIPTNPDGSARRDLGMPIIELVGAHGARLGIDHIIYDRTIWSAVGPDGRPYTGESPHRNHIHWGFTRASATNLTYGTLREVLEGGDELLPLRKGDKKEDVRLLQIRLNKAYGTGLSLDADYGASTVAAVKAHIVRYTGASDLQHGEVVVASMWDGLLGDLILKQSPTQGIDEATVRSLINRSRIRAPS
jgi:hypothetical protein